MAVRALSPPESTVRLVSRRPGDLGHDVDARLATVRRHLDELGLAAAKEALEVIGKAFIHTAERVLEVLLDRLLELGDRFEQRLLGFLHVGDLVGEEVMALAALDIVALGLKVDRPERADFVAEPRNPLLEQLSVDLGRAGHRGRRRASSRALTLRLLGWRRILVGDRNDLAVAGECQAVRFQHAAEVAAGFVGAALNLAL